MDFAQAEYEIRCEWALSGLRASLPGSDVVIIVDVLSFTTCVDIAVGRGASVLPFPRQGESAAAYAASQGALLAGPRAAGGYSLSPASLLALPAGARLVLPSPNGATLSLAMGGAPTLAGCLRNARAVAAAAGALGQHVSVIPAGERWPDGGLRPGLEDWLGAGAIIHYLGGRRSAEAAAAEALFVRYQHELPAWLSDSTSGRELIARDCAEDVALSAALNVSAAVPQLNEGAFSAWPQGIAAAASSGSSEME